MWKTPLLVRLFPHPAGFLQPVPLSRRSHHRNKTAKQVPCLLFRSAHQATSPLTPQTELLRCPRSASTVRLESATAPQCGTSFVIQRKIGSLRTPLWSATLSSTVTSRPWWSLATSTLRLTFSHPHPCSSKKGKPIPSTYHLLMQSAKLLQMREFPVRCKLISFGCPPQVAGTLHFSRLV